MTLLTIGEFARASRQSAKARRMYGEFGLLTPARVDPANGVPGTTRPSRASCT